MVGAILEIFSARFKATIAAFNAEMAPSGHLGRWDSASMDEVEVAGRELCGVNAVRKAKSAGERQFCHDALRRSRFM